MGDGGQMTDGLLEWALPRFIAVVLGTFLVVGGTFLVCAGLFNRNPAEIAASFACFGAFIGLSILVQENP